MVSIIRMQKQRVRGRTLLLNADITSGSLWAPVDGSASVVRVREVDRGRVTYVCEVDGDVLVRDALEFTARYGRIEG